MTAFFVYFISLQCLNFLGCSSILLIFLSLVTILHFSYVVNGDSGNIRVYDTIGYVSHFVSLIAILP